MVMLTLAAGTAKSAEMLGMAVVRTVPSRNSMKNAAATRRARRGFHPVRASSWWSGLLGAAMGQSCHCGTGGARGVRWPDSAFHKPPETQKAPVQGTGAKRGDGGI